VVIRCSSCPEILVIKNDFISGLFKGLAHIGIDRALCLFIYKLLLSQKLSMRQVIFCSSLRVEINQYENNDFTKTNCLLSL
jgi:hypothetical protein